MRIRTGRGDGLRRVSPRAAAFGAGAALLAALGTRVAHAQDGGAHETAVRLIEQYGPQMMQQLDDRFIEAQSVKLAWLFLVLLMILPFLGFIFFVAYPLVNRERVERQLQGAPFSRVTPLYATQGAIFAIVLLVLGTFLFFIQVLMTTLGTYTNPQHVLERQAIAYVVDNREDLVTAYGSIFQAVAQSMAESQDLSILNTIIENGRAIKDDPLMAASASLFRALRPLLSNMFVIAFALLLFGFLRRLWPEVKLMLRYPIDAVAAQRVAYGPAAAAGPMPPRPPGFGQPPAGGYAPGMMPQPAISPSRDMWAKGKRLIWMEVKVFLVFALTATLLALLMALILNQFMTLVVSLLIQLVSTGMVYFIVHEGASTVIVLTMLLLVLFLVEVVAIFLAVFTLLMMKTQSVLREHFLGATTWGLTFSALRNQLLRFGYVIGLLVLLGVVLIFGAAFILQLLVGDGEAGALAAGLLVTAAVLIGGLNLGMWLLRGFKTIRRMR